MKYDVRPLRGQWRLGTIFRRSLGHSYHDFGSGNSPFFPLVLPHLVSAESSRASCESDVATFGLNLTKLQLATN